MRLQHLRWIGILAPTAFLFGLGALLEWGLRPALPTPFPYLIASAIGTLGIAIFATAMFLALERLQAQLVRRGQELEALNEAGMLLASDLSLDTLLQRLVDLARELVPAHYAALSVLGPSGDIQRFVTSGIPDEQVALIGDPPKGRGLLGIVLREGSTLRVHDISADPRSAGFPPHHPVMKSLLAVPIAIGERIIGNLYLADRRDGRPFDDRDEGLLRLLAAWASIAMKNADLYEQERQRAAEWRSLFELGQEVTASRDVEELLDSVVQRSAGLLGADVAALLLLEPEGESLRVAAQQGLLHARKGERLPLSVYGLQRAVMESGQPLVVDEARTAPDAAPGPRALVEEEGLAALVIVPFSVKGNVLGTLTVGSRRPVRFRERQVELLQAFANWAAVAVETRRLYERLESLARLEERERIAMDLHDSIIQSLYAGELLLEDALAHLTTAPEVARQRLERAAQGLDRTITEIRNYIFDLRPRLSTVDDLPEALATLARELQVNTLADVALEVDDHLPALDEQQSLAVYHIAQEALNNVAKHARASRVSVRLWRDGPFLHLEVKDNGIGFDPESASDLSRQGLRNMTDRARSIGAHLSVRSSPGEGTCVSLSLPLTEVER